MSLSLSMPRFDHLKGVLGWPPYQPDYEILTADLRAAAEFCCATGQHGIVWPVMVGEFYFLGEAERIRHLEVVLETVNGRLRGAPASRCRRCCSARRAAGADAIIAMAPARSDAARAMEMFRRLADVYDGPIMLQNAAQYAPLTGEQVATLVHEIPGIQQRHQQAAPGQGHAFGGRCPKSQQRRAVRVRAGRSARPVSRSAGGGDQAGARELHGRLLPLLIRETWPFMRYMLKRRGVFTTLVERARPASRTSSGEASAHLEAVTRDITAYPFFARSARRRDPSSLPSSGPFVPPLTAQVGTL